MTHYSQPKLKTTTPPTSMTDLAGVFDEAAVSLGLLAVAALLVPAVLCLTGVTLCREIIIYDLCQRLPQGIGIRYPRLGWNMAKLMELHRQYFPGSRVPVILRFLTCLGLGFMVSLGLVGVISAFSKPLLR